MRQQVLRETDYYDIWSGKELSPSFREVFAQEVGEALSDFLQTAAVEVKGKQIEYSKGNITLVYRDFYEVYKVLP